jgi:HEAT repeat protein
MNRRVLAGVALSACLLAACSSPVKPLGAVDGVVSRAAAGDAEALGLLPRYFASPVEGEPLKALEALIAAGERAVPVLIEALADNDPVTAESAAGALGNIRDRRAVKPLVAALSRPGFPRYVGIWALGEIGDEEAIPVLVKSLGDASPSVRKYATRSLIKFSGRVVPVMTASLDDPNPWIRHYAVRVLGQVGERASAGPIIERYDRLNPEVALWALGRLGEPKALPILIREAGQRDWKIRLAAIQAMGALARPEGLPVLKKALEDPEWIIREWAARGIEEATTEHQLYRDATGAMVLPYNLYR